MSRKAMLTKRAGAMLMFTIFFGGMSLFTLTTLGILAVPGLLFVSLAMTLTPAIEFCLWDFYYLPPKLVILTVFLPLVIYNFLYALRIGYPVGFADVQFHIVVAENLLTPGGNIDFSRVQAISFTFVGLYLVTFFTTLVSSSPIAAVASWFPPLVNLGAISLIFLILRRTVNVRVSLLATIFFGWENATLLFGHEYRTQTLGTLFTLAVVLLYVAEVDLRTSRTWTTLAAVVLLVVISTASFVSTVFAIILLAGFVLGPLLLSGGKPLQSPVPILIIFTFFMAYVFYISGSPSSVIGSLASLAKDALASTSVAPPSVGQDIYGPVVRAVTYGYWAAFLVFLGALSLRWVKARRTKGGRKDQRLAAVTFAFFVVLIGGTLISIESPLSIARVYTLGSVIIGFVVAMGLIRSCETRRARFRRLIVLLCSIAVILFVVTSAAKLPSYVVGSTQPIRGQQPIDLIPYWKMGSVDSAAAGFLLQHAEGATLDLHVPTTPYMILDLYREGLTEPSMPSLSNGSIVYGSLKEGDLVLLRNTVDGTSYEYRQVLPPLAAYDTMSLIYDSGDYLLFTPNE